ncbi:hypothetical protein SAMN05661010_00303 [Modicisalibacter muralis]|uniref:Uncharacterized protein n=1 Tax=Modicisalibacter muralis TaxID=119000 RepID=A0A1G9F9U8_9GAMM|nr:hypothetical protein [Halomonas muralis]SDK85140.1 hypothetical protein SAMN05661010_00303 [Halomonas muralis]
MPLKRWYDVKDVELPYTESPFFAVSKVARLLDDGHMSNSELNRLNQALGDSLSIDKARLHRDILKAVERGEVCLIYGLGMDQPFSPLAEWTGSQWRLNSSASFDQGESGARKIAQLNARGLTPNNVANARWPASGAPAATSAPAIPERSPQPIVEPPSLIEPGFHIVRTSGTREQIKRRLFPTVTPAIDAMFERLNPHLGDYILPGDMVVLADPGSQQCHQEEAFLMAEARKVQGTLQPLEEAQRQSLMDHWQVFEDIALAGEAAEADSSTLTNAASVLGVTSTAGGRAIKEVRDSLEAIDKLYQQAMDPTHPMTREEFYALRDQHAQRLKLAMGNWVSVPLRLPRHAELKARINIEARQQLHSTATARSGGKFRIPTISEAIARTTLVAKLTSIGAFVGLGLDIAATQSKVERACSEGRERECTRVKYVEYSGLIWRVAASAAGSSAGGTYGAEICLAVSLAPQGRIVCGVVGAVAGAVAGEKAGEKVGEGLGTMLFRGIYGGKETHGTD